MTPASELEVARLVARLPRARLMDPEVLANAGGALQVVWPPEYVSIVSDHNRVEGDVGEWRLVLTPVEDLVELNTDPVMEFFPGLVIIGGDGGGEALAIDRETHEILLVPWIGGAEGWLVLGANWTEALQRMERGMVFHAPHRSRSSKPSSDSKWPPNA